MNWNNITKNNKVKQLLIKRISIEQEIKRLDENALINYELEALTIPDAVEQSEQLPDANQPKCDRNKIQDRINCRFECYNK